MPALYNKTANVLIRRVLYALKIVDDGASPTPIKAFADDFTLKLASDVDAAIALRAASGWEEDMLMRFNLMTGKSVELIEHGKQQDVCRTLGSDALRGSQSDQYLDIGLSFRVATVEPVERRADEASATLMKLKLSKALTR